MPRRNKNFKFMIIVIIFGQFVSFNRFGLDGNLDLRFIFLCWSIWFSLKPLHSFKSKIFGQKSMKKAEIEFNVSRFIVSFPPLLLSFSFSVPTKEQTERQRWQKCYVLRITYDVEMLDMCKSKLSCIFEKVCKRKKNTNNQW